MSHFLSTFSFFGMETSVNKRYHQNLTLDTSVNKFLNTIKAPTVTNIYASRFINPLSFDLGFTKFRTKTDRTVEEKITHFIDFLEKEFDLIMITDAFDESLLTLKYAMDWRLHDILYLKRMVRNTDKPKLSASTIKRVKRYNYVDERIFSHFNQTLFNRFSTLKTNSNFESQLSEFLSRRLDYENYCLDNARYVPAGYKTTKHPLSVAGLSDPSCRVQIQDDVSISKMLSAVQDGNRTRGEEYIVKSKSRLDKVFIEIKNQYLSYINDNIRD